MGAPQALLLGSEVIREEAHGKRAHLDVRPMEDDVIPPLRGTGTGTSLSGCRWSHGMQIKTVVVPSIRSPL